MRIFCRWCYIFGLALLVFSGVSIITNHQGLALRLIIFSFWLLVVGTAIYLFKLNDESKK